MAWAQTEPAPRAASASYPIETFYLSNASQVQDELEIMTALRNILDPSAKMMYVQAQNAVVIASTPDQLTRARGLIKELDRPRKLCRLTYTIIDMDGTKRIGEQHYSMIAFAGQKTQMKQGSKVPIAVGSTKDTPEQHQINYLDIGMSFEATISEFVTGASLKSRIEQSSIAEERSIFGTQDPIVRQTVFEGTSVLSPGKALTLGSIDVPGSTRHLDIQVMMEHVAP
ncbi:MAG TPA: secretin N-terminal domain-containing protein [Edaphobacter sp.]|nr:secretin N-terminal domain-containing protein [Edaphobacter sp.]